MDTIREYERKLNLKFPLAYKEFLFLAGDDSGNLNFLPGASDLEMLGKESYRARLFQQMKEANVDFDGRPIWVITEMDGFEQFLFFYLDEEVEDPKMFQANLVENIRYFPSNETFSEFMDGLVDQSISIAKRGY
jgi:hypothetical protein